MWMFPKNRGTPKSSILIGFSLINHLFWGVPIVGNTHLIKMKSWLPQLHGIPHSLVLSSPALRGRVAVPHRQIRDAKKIGKIATLSSKFHPNFIHNIYLQKQDLIQVQVMFRKSSSWENNHTFYHKKPITFEETMIFWLPLWDMVVSKNRDAPKWMVYNGKPY